MSKFREEIPDSFDILRVALPPGIRDFISRGTAIEFSVRYQNQERAFRYGF